MNRLAPTHQARALCYSQSPRFVRIAERKALGQLFRLIRHALALDSAAMPDAVISALFHMLDDASAGPHPTEHAPTYPTPFILPCPP